MRPRLLTWLPGLLVLASCSRQRPIPEPAPHDGTIDMAPRPLPPPTAPAEPVAAPAPDAAVEEEEDPMATHVVTQPDLLKLVTLPPAADERAAARRDGILAYLVAPSPGHFNQGNRAIAHHTISRAKCMAGLKDVVLQTDEQRAVCKDQPYMVPVYTNGDIHSAKACIDVFEFPNRPCELPFVWGSPAEAEAMCRIQGKRLCSQQEWTAACSADPEGKQKWPYAYGDKLDLEICNTNTPHEAGPDGKAWRCWVRDATTTWQTCSTNTEPAGSYPRCRSRLGVFDQHGSVAEEMTRVEDGETYTQLKGSAFFYVDVAREPGKVALHPERESYPDTCAYDPRWHVEKLKESLHCNYHLGFRCCLQL